MSQTRELMLPGEFLTLVALIGLLVLVGNQMARPNALTYQQARRFTATAIVLYAAVSLFAWPPESFAEFLVVLLRTALAAGVVFSASTLLLAIVHHLVGDPVNAVVSKYREWTVERERRLAGEKERRDTAAGEQREQAERTRQAKLLIEEQRRQAEETEQRERQREARIDEARNELIRFYEDHAEPLKESLPPALFRSQLKTRFPAAVSPEEAWQAAQSSIAEMLPLIAAGREKQRTEERQAQERDRDAQRLRKQIRSAQAESESLNASSAGDADVRDSEARALREQIREWEAELESLETSAGALQ